jgi:hypothetical protein
LIAGAAGIAVECSDRETIIRQLALALQEERFPQSEVITGRARELTGAHQIERLREVVAPLLQLTASD